MGEIGDKRSSVNATNIVDAWLCGFGVATFHLPYYAVGTESHLDRNQDSYNFD